MSGRRKGDFAHRIENPEKWSPPLQTEKNESGLYVPVRSLGDSYSPTILSPNAFKAGFAVMGDTQRGRRAVGELGMTPNWDALQSHPRIQQMAEHIKAAYQASLNNKTMYTEGRTFYNKQNKEMAELGERFNETRAQRGMPTYFENDPAVAGIALSHLYRHAGARLADPALAKTLKTGEVGRTRAFRTHEAMANAIEQGVHPLDILAQQQGGHGGEDYDIAGATLNQNKWKGSWGGVQRGIGYPITSSQHDMARGAVYETDRGIKGNSPTAARRYMAFQGAHLLAQHGPGGIVETTGTNDPPARFQAITNMPWSRLIERTGGRIS